MSADTPPTPRSLTASEYVLALFEPSENVAILVRNRATGKTVQRIARAENVANPEFQTWLANQNSSGSDVYIGMNPIKDGAYNRTKGNIQSIRHVYLGTKVVRTILKPEQTRALADKLKEPYATLVLFLAVTGLRISEALGIKWSDFEGNVLHVSRRIYEGESGDTKTSRSVRSLPIPEALLARMRKLGDGQWVFRSRVGKTLNPGNALKRYIHPASRELGFRLGGWHDFRHTMATQSMMGGAPTKVISEILGHSDVQTTMKVYQHTSTESFRGPLERMSSQLL
jgi:integrase